MYGHITGLLSVVAKTASYAQASVKKMRKLKQTIHKHLKHLLDVDSEEVCKLEFC